MTTTDAHGRPITSPAVWQTADVADRGEWTIELSEEQRHELVSAARDARTGGRTVATLTRADAALPSLRTTLDEVVDALSRGRGFVLLSRFPTDLLTETEAELAYFALGLHLGTPVSQDAAGTLLGHVRRRAGRKNRP